MLNLRTRRFVLLICTVNLCGVFVKSASIEMNKVVCELLDKDCCSLAICRLNKIKNNAMALQLNGTINQKNINNITIAAKLFKKINKNYRQFLYDDVIDFCDFQKNRKRQVYWNLVFGKLAEHSNVNHTCPYADAFIVDNLTFGNDEFKILPFPRGQYMTQLMIGTYNVYRFKVEVYTTVK